jgi:hypothetical protein
MIRLRKKEVPTHRQKGIDTIQRKTLARRRHEPEMATSQSITQTESTVRTIILAMAKVALQIMITITILREGGSRLLITDISADGLVKPSADAPYEGFRGSE